MIARRVDRNESATFCISPLITYEDVYKLLSHRNVLVPDTYFFRIEIELRPENI